MFVLFKIHFLISCMLQSILNTFEHEYLFSRSTLRAMYANGNCFCVGWCIWLFSKVLKGLLFQCSLCCGKVLSGIHHSHRLQVFASSANHRIFFVCIIYGIYSLFHRFKTRYCSKRSERKNTENHSCLTV